MVVFPFLPLVIEIFRNVKVRKLGRLHDVSAYFEGKSTKVFVVDSPSCLDVFLYVLPEGLNDEMELGLGIKGLGSFVCTRLGLKVLSGVIIWMFDDPMKNKKSRTK